MSPAFENDIAIFCLAGLVICPEVLASLVSVLHEPVRQSVEKQTHELRKLSREELIERWRALRDRESDDLRKLARSATGGTFDQAPPNVQRWVLSRLAESNGREHYQS
jgi:hypothetical protein